MEMMTSRYGQILCISDPEEVLLNVVRPVALKLGLPIGTSPVERPQANGPAEQRVRNVRERLHVILAEMLKKGFEVLESPTLTSWAVRHAKWTANHLVKSDVEMVDGSNIKVSPYEAHTGKLVAGKLAASWNESCGEPGRTSRHNQDGKSERFLA